jgi:hypothetical protein
MRNLTLAALFIINSASAAGSNPVIPIPAGSTLPTWPKPVMVQLSSGAPAIRSKDLELIHSPDSLGGFIVRVAGKPMAIGQTRPMIGFVTNANLQWFDLANAANRKLTVRTQRNSLRVHFECTDADGARWEIEQEFTPGSASETIELNIAFKVDRDRAVAFLPMFTLFPGAGSFGEVKGQALLAGLEYLENEPSSSEADVIGPASKRQVPDSLKLTFPLMVIQNQDHWLALTWQMRPHFSALFDSPDRLFGSGGHVMGLLFPGSDGQNRQEGSLLPKVCETLHGDEPLVLRATLFSGAGRSVVPAVA